MKVPDGVRLESRPCPLCLVAEDEPVLSGVDMLHGVPGEYRVIRCRQCGLMRTDPRPTPDTIGLYYPSHYGPHANADIDSDGGADRLRFCRLMDAEYW